MDGSKLIEVGTFFASPPSTISPEVLKNLKKVSDSTVLVGRHASGVMIAPNLMVTSRHVITDYATGPTTDCARIPLFLFHERLPDGTRSPKLKRIECEEVIVNENLDQTAILKVKGANLPYAPFAKEYSQVRAGEVGLALGHPYAREFDASTTRISEGKIALHITEDTDFPHVVHLITTEGGHSGGAITNANGEVIAVQLGGIARYSQGLMVDLGQGPVKITRFNFAVSMPFLYQKYRRLFPDHFIKD